jgi:sugar lactone lactonase YvrE
MRKFLLAALAVVCGVSVGRAALPPFKLNPSEYMPVSQVRSGMKGYGLTVFRGVTIERFGVEVIDVMPNQNVGQPLILIRMSGGPITERKANIIGGMSGSPVYINGRLIGAVAYGNQFPNEPIAMVTPIENMVDAFDPNLPSKPLVASAPGTVPSNMASVFAPAPIPVYAGVGARALAVLNSHLKPYGLQAMQGGGGGGGTSSRFPKGVRLEPGSGIGVSLMQGDVDITGIGTVTYRKGDRILAFGHPMLQLGPAEFPACTVWIHDVFSSPMRSNKMGSPIETVGTILQDRPFSVGGLIRRQPKMVPLTVKVTDHGTGRAKTFHMKMVNHPSLISGLVSTGTTEVVDRLRGFPGDAMATTTFTIKAEGLPPITRTNRVYDANAINAAAALDVSEAAQLLVRNPFEVVPIQSVYVDVQIESGRKTATVERAWLERDRVEPGEEVGVDVVVKPYRGAPETRRLTFRVPENSPTGQAQIVVFGGLTGVSRTGAAAGAGASAANIRQLVDRWLEREPNDVLGARMLLPGTVVTVEGNRFAGLPDVFADVMKSTKASSTRLERDEVKASLPMPYVMTGSQMLVLNIERKPVLEKAKPAAPTSSSATTTSTSSSSETEGGSTSSAAYVLAGDEEWARPALEPAQTVRRVIIALPPGATLSNPPETAKGEEQKAEEKKETAPAASGADAKGPGRAAAVWRQNSKAQFDTGRTDGTTVADDGTVRLSPRLKPVADLARPYVWSVLPLQDGGVLAGTGNGGEIVRVSADGKTSVFAETGALQVQCLLPGPDGAVYAGTSPDGRVVRVDRDGRVAPLAATGERYVFAMAPAPDGLYAATGPNGRVLRISSKGSVSELVRLPETNVLSLSPLPNGDLLAGTSPDGLVYRITPEGQASVVYDANETNATAAVQTADGTLYVATAPGSRVYRVDGGGRAEVVLEKPDGNVLALAAGPDGVVYAAGGRKVYRIAPDKTVTTLDNQDQSQIVALALAPDGSLVAGSANTGVVYRSNADSSGLFTSSVMDAALCAAWGRAELAVETPTNGSVSMETRTGSVAQPDATWSEWKPLTPEGAVASPPDRFIQYRLTLRAGDGGVSPIVRAVGIRYLTENRAPTVRFSAPKESDRWSGKQTVKWTGSDPDSDVLTYDVLFSPDNGGTWTALDKVAKAEAKPAEASEPAAPAAKEDAGAAGGATAPPTKGKAKSDSAGAASPSQAKDEPKPAEKKEEKKEPEKATGTTKTQYTWDTSSVPDGIYRLKVVATDRASNPASPLVAEDISGTLIVCNTKPALTIGVGPDVRENRTVSLSGDATSPAVSIVRISYRVDGGDWAAAVPADGMFDSPSERWRLTTDPLAPGEHKLEVRATDDVGNNGATEVKVTVQ